MNKPAEGSSRWSHAPSGLIGVGLTLAFLVLPGMTQTATHDRPVLTTQPLLVFRSNPFAHCPNPNDIVNLVEGTPYTVPAEKVLIITDYSVSDVYLLEGNTGKHILHPRVRVNGVDLWGTGFTSSYNHGVGFGYSTESTVLTHSMRSGLRVDSGQSVTLHANPLIEGGAVWPTTPLMFASGYLAKAQ